MICKLLDGELVNSRSYNYIADWLNEKSKGEPMTFLNTRFDKFFINELTHSEFWELFHQAVNDEMQDKF